MTTQQTTTNFEAFSTQRTDVHRPSAIQPEDYTYVCVNYTPGAKDGDFGEMLFLNEQRAFLRSHMERTGGTWSQHQHGGNCHVCGAHAMYTVTFYHAVTNSYIRTGFDCAEKMEAGDARMFRAFKTLQGEVRDARELATGKRKAQAILADANLMQAWALYLAEYSDSFQNEEHTVRDMVGKLVKYGSISDKALGYMRTLLGRIDNRAAMLAQREAEKAQAADCVAGRYEIVGRVLSIKLVDSSFGTVEKMLVQHSTGWKVWGTVPSNLTIEKGAEVAFTAMVQKSPDDRTFGFYSRPTKARVITPAVPNA